MLDIFLDVLDDPEQNKEVKLDLEIIKGLFFELIVAGIDTSSNVAAMCLYNMSK